MATSTAPFHHAEDAVERGEGICRTCLLPIWNEGGTVSGQRRETGWSDRIKRGGDSLVCFSATEYRHVPLTGREASVYDRAYRRGAAEARAGETGHVAQNGGMPLETARTYTDYRRLPIGSVVLSHTGRYAGWAWQKISAREWWARESNWLPTMKMPTTVGQTTVVYRASGRAGRPASDHQMIDRTEV